MEFFREKNGRFHAQPITGSGARSPIVRFVVTLIPIAILAGLYFLSPLGEKGSADRTPLILGGAVVLFGNVVSFFLRSAGFGSGITVDQMNGTISFRKPGGNRTTVQVTSLKNITINTIPGKASILCLSKPDKSRYVVMFSKDTDKMRRLADEFSSLTSLTVTEELRETNSNDNGKSDVAHGQW